MQKMKLPYYIYFTQIDFFKFPFTRCHFYSFDIT